MRAKRYCRVTRFLLIVVPLVKQFGPHPRHAMGFSGLGVNGSDALGPVGRKPETVVNAPIKNARKMPQELYKSLTWDRGKDIADHKRFTLATDIKVYFCDPQNPWQRGINENTNGQR